MFKEIFTESVNYIDGKRVYGDKIYKDIIRDIIDVNKNFAMSYNNGRIDVLPKSAKEGDLTSGPALAEKILPKINKAIKKYGIKAETFDIQQSSKSKRRNKALYGGIKIKVI